MYKTLKYLMVIPLKNYIQQNDCGLLNPKTGAKTSGKFVADFLKSKRLTYFGEVHGVPKIVKFQESVLDFMVNEVREERKGDDDDIKVVVIMEHFAGPQNQELLDRFMERGNSSESEMSVESLMERHRKVANEGHNLAPYTNFLKYAKSNSDVVELKAGFIPRSYAKLLVKEGVEAGLEAAYKDGYLVREGHYKTYWPGSDNHYNFFESLISGRDLSLPPSERFRKIFPAQILKDAAMAHIIVSELCASARNKLLVICGHGHCDYRFGVPERVDMTNVIQKENTCVISTRNIDEYGINWEDGETDASLGPFEKVDHFENKFPADIILFYNSDQFDESEIMDVDVNAAHMAEEIKAEISDAYNQVSETAHIEGDSQLAATVMKFLEYTDEQIQIAGRDAFNYQGVGNPHKHAHIKKGDNVLDLGSGLGVDSFIAAERAGIGGKVVGMDISKGEVVHANKRAKARGISEHVNFVAADMENMPLESNSMDVVISNGAFCLAPDKEKAFKEIFRVLKPGGHFSVACTTLLKELDAEVNWPICMRVFMPLVHVRPMLDCIGFINVEIDSSNSLMVYSLEVESRDEVNGHEDEENRYGASEKNESRKKIHVGSEEFKHLETFDMNELCARVILHGRKPL